MAAESTEYVEDMITLQDLTEETMLKNLKLRYAKNLIYTYTGSILISVNPYQLLPLYTADIVRQYVGQRIGSLPPHIFAIADAAYRNMTEDGRNQSIIISGESGAGKTEATKLILQYLASRTNKHSIVEQKILEASPVLEAFGNAKTVRNNNSSRFGKYIEIHFNKEGFIVGARIIQYLLEKSRIAHQASSERNYHVFYQLCAGLSEEERERLCLREPQHYHYLNQSGCTTIDGVDDAEEFNRVQSALTFLGVSDSDQSTLWELLAAILHLGNIEFVGAKPAGGGGGNEKYTDGSAVKNVDVLEIASRLLQVPSSALGVGLTQRSVVIGGQKFIIPLKPDEACDARDALAKTLYNRLFEWLVIRINQSIEQGEQMANFIGVLDIFGFENFQMNSFEQLCINYANEKLQQLFNQHIFKQEQQEYEREKINWSRIKFNDNQECLDLIEKKPVGILSLIDEECRFPKATDTTLLDKLHKNCDKHSYYEKPKISKTTFIVKHYAGDVSYDIRGFLEKNKDTLPEDLLQVITTSQSKFLRDLFPPELEAVAYASGGTTPRGSSGGGGTTSKKPGRLTVGAQFKEQLIALVSTLSATAPHYVRCIKPNTLKMKERFDDDMVMAQLRYAGMMETIRIRRIGYPLRRTFAEFYKRYKILAPIQLGADPSARSTVDCLLRNMPQGILDDGEWQLGLTLVFLRDKQAAKLEDARAARLAKAIVIVQATWRMFTARRYFCQLRKAVMVAQKLARGRTARKRFYKQRSAVVTLQSFARMLRHKKNFTKTRARIVTAQKYVRRHLAKKEYKRRIAEKRQREQRMREIAALAEAEERERRHREELDRQRAEREAEERRQRELEERIREKTREEEARRRAEEEKRRQEEAINELRAVGALESLSVLVGPPAGVALPPPPTGDSAAAAQSASFLSTLDPALISDVEELDALIARLNEESFGLPGDSSTATKPPEAISLLSTNLAAAPVVNGAPSPALSLSTSTANGPSLDDILSALKTAGGEQTSVGMREDTIGRDRARSQSVVLPPVQPVESMRESGTAVVDATTPRGVQPVLTSKVITANKPASEIITREEINVFNFREWAVRLVAQGNEAIHAQSKKRRGAKPVDPSELLLFSKKLLTTSLLRLEFESEAKVAAEIFERILCYCGDKRGSTDTMAHARFILSKGLACERLRDEIYMQLCKQITANPSEESTRHAWELMGMCCACFPPNSQNSQKRFGAFLLEHSRSDTDYPAYCMRALRRTATYGARRMVPSTVEIESIRNAAPVVCRFHLADGTAKGFYVDSATTAAETLTSLAERYGIADASTWAVYEVYSGVEYSLEPEEFICDALSRFESLASLSAATSSSAAVATKDTASAHQPKAKLVFKKRLFTVSSAKRPLSDSEVDLLYFQAVRDILSGRLAVADPHDVALLAALMMQAELGDWDPTREFAATAYLPRRVLGTSPTGDGREWKDDIFKEHERLRGMTRSEARKRYLATAMGLPGYGGTKFTAQNAGESGGYSTAIALPKEVDVVISAAGLQLFNSSDTSLIAKYGYGQIKTAFGTPKTVEIALRAEHVEKTIVLSTLCGKEIASLLRDYGQIARMRSRYAKATRDYAVNDPNLLTFLKGDIIDVMEREDPNWWIGKCKGRIGSFPADHVEIVIDEPTETFASVAAALSKGSGPPQAMPPPTAAPPQPPSKPASSGGTIRGLPTPPPKPGNVPSLKLPPRPPSPPAPAIAELPPQVTPKPPQLATLAVPPLKPPPLPPLEEPPQVPTALPPPPIDSAKLPPPPPPSEGGLELPPPPPAVIPALPLDLPPAPPPPGAPAPVQRISPPPVAPTLDLPPPIAAGPTSITATSSTLLSPRSSMSLKGFGSLFTEVAESRFRTVAKRGTLRVKTTKIDIRSRTEWSSEPIGESLLEMADSHMNKEAKEMFIDIMKFMEDYPIGKVKKRKVAQAIVQRGIDHPALRDEIYCQLFKQVSNNPRVDSTKAGWHLLAMCAGCFLPSADFEKAFLELVEAKTLDALVAELANDVLERFQRTKAGGGRRHPPCGAEFESITTRMPLVQRFFLPDGSKKVIQIQSWTTVAEATATLANTLHLKHKQGYGLFSVLQSNVMRQTPLKEKAYLCDIIYNYEKMCDKSGDESAAGAPAAGLGESEFKFVFKRKMFLTPKIASELTGDPVAFGLLFHQLLEDVMTGRLVVNSDEAANLAALLVHISRSRDTNASAAVEAVTVENVENFVPRYVFSQKSRQEWVSAIQLLHFEIAGETEESAKLLYIKGVSQLPMYGSIVFPCKQKERPNNVLVAVNRDGISLYEAGARDSLAFWHFSTISNWCIPAKDQFHMVGGNLLKPDRRTFNTPDAEELMEVVQAFFDDWSDAAVKARRGTTISRKQ